MLVLKDIKDGFLSFGGGENKWFGKATIENGEIKVGVVGTGFIGPAHIEALRRLPNIEVAALCDSTIESATVKASKLGIERVGFAKTLAVVWTDRLIQSLTLLKIRPRCPSFPEWPKHVPGTSQLASFAGRGHGWLAL